MRTNGGLHIPSEALEPIYAVLIGVWFEQVQRGSMSNDHFRERMRALSAVASEAGATHCVLATGNDLYRFDRWAEKNEG
jgi:hypothetical protein